MKSLKDRIAALEARTDNSPHVYCDMKDGSKRTYYGVDVIQPFLDEEISRVRTDDADIAALLRAFNVEDTTVDII